MNKEQIKDLIASKIAGQGSAVDAGSALPDILNAIIDSIPEEKKPLRVLIEDGVAIEGTLQEVADLMEITEENARLLFNGEIPQIQIPDIGYIIPQQGKHSSIGNVDAVYYFLRTDDASFFLFIFTHFDENYSVTFYNVE